MGIATQRNRSGNKRPTNISIRADLMDAAKALNINISQAAEQGIQECVARKQAAVWLAENKAALESSNTYVEEHGLPLARFKVF